MQDFQRYNYNLTIERLAEISEEYDGAITVIINGEYYNIVKKESEDE